MTIQHPTSAVRSLTGLQMPNESPFAVDWPDSEVVVSNATKTTDANCLQDVVSRFMTYPHRRRKAPVAYARASTTSTPEVQSAAVRGFLTWGPHCHTMTRPNV